MKSLVRAEILALRPAEYFRGREIHVSEGLQTDFSIMHALGLFLVSALDTLDPKAPDYALDVVSFVEAIIEDPTAILIRQLDKKKGDLIAEWKAEGIEYDERMRRLEEVTWDRPKAEALYELFNIFEAAHPWLAVADSTVNVRPKSVLRDMYERYMSFNEYVRELGLEKIEGSLLRYLSEGFKTLVHTVPVKARTEELIDLIAFFRTVLARVDSSLIHEWERLMYGEEQTALPELGKPLDITRDKRAFHARIRSELHALVKALSLEDWEECARLVRQDADDAWPPERFAKVMEDFYVTHERVVFDHAARLADKTQVRAEGRHEFVVQQVLVDPAGDNDWGIEGTIDLRDDAAPEGPMIALRRLGI
jgi:hypothetical protein